MATPPAHDLSQQNLNQRKNVSHIEDHHCPVHKLAGMLPDEPSSLSLCVSSMRLKASTTSPNPNTLIIEAGIQMIKPPDGLVGASVNRGVDATAQIVKGIEVMASQSDRGPKQDLWEHHHDRKRGAGAKRQAGRRRWARIKHQTPK